MENLLELYLALCLAALVVNIVCFAEIRSLMVEFRINPLAFIILTSTPFVNLITLVFILVSLYRRMFK